VPAPTPAQLRASGTVKISAALHALALPPDTPVRFHAPGVAEIVRALLDCPQSAPFRHSVNKRDIPDYDKVRTARVGSQRCRSAPRSDRRTPRRPIATALGQIVPFPRDLGGIKTKVRRRAMPFWCAGVRRVGR